MSSRRAYGNVAMLVFLNARIPMLDNEIATGELEIELIFNHMKIRIECDDTGKTSRKKRNLMIATVVLLIGSLLSTEAALHT